MADKPTLTLRELQNRADAAQGGKGLECRKCGCKDFRVETTRRGENMIVRYRVCRYCGAKRQTLES